MPVKSKSRITIACNSCRMRKQKWESCLQHRRNCDWPEQLKRGPAKGYIESLEHRLYGTENLLLGLLTQVSDTQLAAGIRHSTNIWPRPTQRGSRYWKQFPLLSVPDIRAWQGDCQQDTQLGSTSTPLQSLAQSPTTSGELPVSTEEHSRSGEPEPEPEPEPSPAPAESLQLRISEPQNHPSVWSGAPSLHFQQQFLW
ncbi:hypothetical protein ARAM_002698 [Aspergillus rambellii]|uniref:Zn(2)-C6 fungal-type domain-containing protein n=1 Tax=Aspergillus rambellii TaxID=308745 RepID=A0A0F8WLU5_9EURO|nr:hypothetical protein ARAM_002698 [Aspergillus rambellii]